MAKQSGIPTSFSIDDSGGSPVTFSNSVATISLDISQAVQEVSGLDVTGTERITLRGDWSASLNGFWDDGSDVVDVFGDIRGERDVVITYPGRTFTGVAVIGRFGDAIGEDGSDGWSAEISSQDGTFPTLA